MKEIYPILFTPGPLKVSERVRDAFIGVDVMHRGYVFTALLSEVHKKLFQAFEVSDRYFPVIFTATGRGANEAMVAPYVLNRQPLFITNGSWGDNLIEIAGYYKKKLRVLNLPKDRKIDASIVADHLDLNPEIDSVFVVHHETRSGILNNLAAISEAVKSRGLKLLVDAMSSAILEETDFEELGVDMFTTSSAKGLRSFPGLSIVCGKADEFESFKNSAIAAHYFDIYKEFAAQKKDVRVRFAQSSPLFFALREALDELLEEGVASRRADIHEKTLNFRKWAKANSFESIISENELGHVVTTYKVPGGNKYYDLRSAMRSYGIFLLYGDSIEGSQFQVSLIGAVDNSEINQLKEAILDVKNDFLKTHVR